MGLGWAWRGAFTGLELKGVLVDGELLGERVILEVLCAVEIGDHFEIIVRKLPSVFGE